MKEYHKIHGVYKRDEKGKFIIGDWSLEEFDYLQNNEWEFTEKVDGTNIRVMFDGETITFAGKTNKAQIPSFLVNHLNNSFMSIEKRELFKEKFPDGVCFYGEGYGARIQGGGGNYRKDQSFVLFDVLCGSWWLKREDIEDVAKTFGIDVVPVVGYGTIHDAIKKVTDGFNSTWGNFIAEGLVLRSKVYLADRRGGRIITKIKHKDFVKHSPLVEK